VHTRLEWNQVTIEDGGIEKLECSNGVRSQVDTFGQRTSRERDARWICRSRHFWRFDSENRKGLVRVLFILNIVLLLIRVIFDQFFTKKDLVLITWSGVAYAQRHGTTLYVRKSAFMVFQSRLRW
jgi:hypothetical protein